MQKFSLSLVVGIVITLTWSASVAADILSTSYSQPVEIHGIMALVAGGLFGKEAFDRARQSAEDDK